MRFHLKRSSDLKTDLPQVFDIPLFLGQVEKIDELLDLMLHGVSGHAVDTTKVL